MNLVPPNTGEDYHSGGRVPTEAWTCLEWEFNDTPDQATVYTNGAPSYTYGTFTFNGASSGLVGGFSTFRLGFYAWHGSDVAFDVFYDDIVLDTKRTGCPPP